MEDKLYFYKAKFLSIYDPDSMTFLIDLGWNVHIKEKARLWGIDSPEKRSRNPREKALCLEGIEFVKEKLEKSADIYVKTLKDKKGKFGRMLLVVYYSMQEGSETRYINLNEELVEKGYAREYFGKKKQPWNL